MRTAGPLPTLAIGNQPYGLLPVTTLNPGRNQYASTGKPSLLAIFCDVHQYPEPNVFVIGNYARTGYDLTSGKGMQWSFPLSYEIVNRLPGSIPNPGSYKVLGVHAANLIDRGSSDLIFCYSLADAQGLPTLYYSVGRSLDDLGLAGSVVGPFSLRIGWAGDQCELCCTALFDVDRTGRPDLVLLSSSVFQSGTRFYSLAIAQNLDQSGQVPADGWPKRTNIPLNVLDPLNTRVSAMTIAYVAKVAQPDVIVAYTDSNHLYYRVGKGLDASGNITGGWASPLELRNPYPASVPLTKIKVSIAVTSTTFGQQNDLLVVWDADSDPNGPYWAIGRVLDANGRVTGAWTDFFSMPPGWFGQFAPEAGPLREHVKAITVLPRAQTSPLDVLRSLWRRWRQSAGNPDAPQGVPRLTSSATLDQDLRSSLSMTGQSRNVAAFVLLGKLADYYNAYRPKVFPPPDNIVLPAPTDGASFLSEFYSYLLDRARSQDAGWIRTANEKSYPITQGYPLRPVMVQEQAGAGDQPLEPNYVRWMRTCGFRDIRNETYFTCDPDFYRPPETLLYLLLRHATLLEYGLRAERIRKQADLPVPPAEPELVDMGPTPTPTIWRQLEEPVASLTGTQALGDYLDQPSNLHHSQVQALDQYRQSLRKLEGLPVATLERLMLETLDAGAYRLDAWITSVASRRLDQLRQTETTRTGIYLGGYGWVEHLGRSPRFENARPIDNVPDESSDPAGPLYEDAGNTGYVHAPSLPQAVTAAILRSGYLSHQTLDDKGKITSSNNDLLAIDLSSERVRAALWLLDGIRAGQSLGALLGYRFERGLHEHSPGLMLDRYLPVFRHLAPPVISKTRDAGSQPTAGGAERVLNGLGLLRRYQKALSTPNPVWDTTTIPFGMASPGETLALPPPNTDDPTFIALVHVGLHTTTVLTQSRQAAKGRKLLVDFRRAVLEAELRALADVVDAASDVCISESVYQLMQGNHMRSGATLDAISRGTVPPPEMQVLRTPRSGIGLTHRILALFSGSAPDTPGWATGRPRASAEPLLNAWAARLLGDPERVECRARYVRPGSSDPISTVPEEPIKLATLGLCPLDVIYAAAGTAGGPAFSEIEQRLTYEARRRYASKQAASSNLPAAADVVLTYERSDRGLTFPQLYEIARTMRDLFANARPIDARDLALPQQAAGPAIDVDELRNRAEVAKSDLNKAATKLGQKISGDNPKDLREALLDLSAFGLAAATPQSAGDTAADLQALMAQAGPVADEARRRLTQLATMEAGFESVYTLFSQSRNTLQTGLQNPGTADIGALRQAMLQVAALGVTGAVPKVGGSTPAERQILLSQAADTHAELTARLAAMDDPETQRGHQTERLQALFGAEFRVVLRFRLDSGKGLRTDLEAAFAASAGQGADPNTALAWFQRVAQVRPGVGRLDTALLYAEATQSGATAGFSVAQLPVKRADDTRPLSDRWIALPLDGRNPPRGRLSLVVHAPGAATPATPPDLSQSLGGVLIEDWTEVLPSATETTAVTFHYDAPDATAPQAVLLAVTPEGSAAWDLPTLETIVLETLELSKMRLSEQAFFKLPGDTGQLPPALSALYFAVNGNVPDQVADRVTAGDTVSTNFLRLANQAVRFVEPLPDAVVVGKVTLKVRAPNAEGVAISASWLHDPGGPVSTVGIGNAIRQEDDPDIWTVDWDTTRVDPNVLVVTLIATLLDEHGNALETHNTCRVNIRNHP